MTEDEANARAAELNRELGLAGEGERFWISVPAEDGWDVELRRGRQSKRSLLVDAVLSFIGL